MSLVLRGALEERVGASSVDARVCDLVVKPRGTKHENVYLAADTTLVQVTLPAATIRRALDAGCPVDRWSWRSGTPTARALAALARLASQGSEGGLDGVVDEALATLGAGTKPRPRGPVPAWLGRVRDALDEAYEDGGCAPKIADLARDAGVHRVHLSREFLRYFGASPTEYRQQARLRAAARRLGTSAGSLSGAAYRSGFADQSHMTREFRRWLGITPLEYRKLVPAPGDGGGY